MKTSRLTVVLCSLSLAAVCAAADDAGQPPSARDMLRARLAEEAKQPTTKGEPVTPTATSAAAPAQPATSATGSAAPAKPVDQNPLLAKGAGKPAQNDASTPATTRAQPATVLPQVEVRKGRITVLDQQLVQQDQEIAREKKNAKPSEVDKALNDSKIAKPLAIFGGESAQFRAQVSSERVSLMEDEKDILEAIAHAKTKEEKAALKKQLDALREERRQLEQALR